MKINFDIDIDHDINSSCSSNTQVKSTYKYTSFSVISHLCLLGLLFSSALFAENIIMEEGDDSIKAIMIDLSQVAAPALSLTETTLQNTANENNDVSNNHMTEKPPVETVEQPKLETEKITKNEKIQEPVSDTSIVKKPVVVDKKEVVKKQDNAKKNPPPQSKSSLQQTKQVIDSKNIASTAVAPSISNNQKFAAKPSPISRGYPEYPRRALDMRINGYVIAKYDINDNGRVENIRIIESVPKNTFNRSVTNAMKSWRYSPVQSKDLTIKIIFNQNQTVSLESANL